MDGASVRRSPQVSVDGRVDLLFSLDEGLDQSATLDEGATRGVDQSGTLDFPGTESYTW
jgi:hypothetical protein